MFSRMDSILRNPARTKNPQENLARLENSVRQSEFGAAPASPNEVTAKSDKSDLVPLPLQGLPSESPKKHRANMRHVGIQGIDKALLEEAYYHGVVGRPDVDEALQRDGDFLVCMPQDESSRNVVSLAVRFNGRPRYFVVGKTKKGRFHVSSRCFDTVPLMVAHYAATREAIHPELPIVLKRAVPHPAWLLSHDRIRLGDQIGKGAFGCVYKAQLIVGSAVETVAVKTFRGQTTDSRKLSLFLQEARTMRNYKHAHIVHLVGIACQQEPLMIVLEFAGGGSLLHHLRNQGINLGVAQRYHFAAEAASGMRYLEKLKCIHRDVAARNCLLTEALQVKIADFGLSMKEAEQMKELEDVVMPIRWLAPEVLRNHLFSTKSDVWAFGVLLYEIFTDGAEPYPGMTTKEVRARLTDFSGFRMEMSVDLPPAIRRLIHDCWQEEPTRRPTFKALHKSLDKVKF